MLSKGLKSVMGLSLSSSTLRLGSVAKGVTSVMPLLHSCTSNSFGRLA